MRRLSSFGSFRILLPVLAVTAAFAQACSSSSPSSQYDIDLEEYETKLKEFELCAAGVPSPATALPNGDPSTTLSAELRALPEQSLAAIIRDGQRGTMRKQVEVERYGARVKARCGVRPLPPLPPNGFADGGAPQMSPGSPNSASAGEGRASQSTGTNNQVAGVDEADFLKNDGKY